MATEIERIEKLGQLLGVKPRDVPTGLYVRWMIIGAEMARKLVRKVDDHPMRKSVSIHVRESNLCAQLFFKSMGFRAVAIIRDWFEDTGECAFQFVHTVGCR
jgi:hypothetical protein